VDPFADLADVKLDDILDASVGLAVAAAIVSGPGTGGRLPAGEPPRDERGLRMEINY
jgi:hypothetical protein